MKKPCDLCNGTGQLSTFKGVSRFVVTWEECPECAGLGYTITENQKASPQKMPTKHPNRSRRKKRSGS